MSWRIERYVAISLRVGNARGKDSLWSPEPRVVWYQNVSRIRTRVFDIYANSIISTLRGSWHRIRAWFHGFFLILILLILRKKK